VDLKGQRLRIPSNYIWYNGDDEDCGGGVSLALLLPDFEPRTAKNDLTMLAPRAPLLRVSIYGHRPKWHITSANNFYTQEFLPRAGRSFESNGMTCSSETSTVRLSSFAGTNIRLPM